MGGVQGKAQTTILGAKCWGGTGWEVGLEGGTDGQEVMGNLRRDSALVHGVTSRVSPDM